MNSRRARRPFFARRRLKKGSASQSKKLLAGQELRRRLFSGSLDKKDLIFLLSSSKRAE